MWVRILSVQSVCVLKYIVNIGFPVIDYSIRGEALGIYCVSNNRGTINPKWVQSCTIIYCFDNHIIWTVQNNTVYGTVHIKICSST